MSEQWEGCEEVHWDCRIAQLEAELDRLREQEINYENDIFLGQPIEYWMRIKAQMDADNSDNYVREILLMKMQLARCDEELKIIDQFITHYNDAVSAGKVSVDVKRDLSDAEIEELGAQEAERKEFCPNCKAETPCTHEAELFVCDICGEDFAKYIVSRSSNVSDVSVTQDVLTSVKTPQSVENNNPDYYKGAEKTALVRLCGVLGVLTENNDLSTAALLAATRIERLEKKIPALNVDLAEASMHAYNGEIARMKLEDELARRINELHYANTVCMEQKHELARLTAELAELRTVLKSKDIIIDNQEKRINELAERILKND